MNDESRKHLPIEERGGPSETTVTHVYSGTVICTNPASESDEIRLVIDKRTHNLSIPKEKEDESFVYIYARPKQAERMNDEG